VLLEDVVEEAEALGGSSGPREDEWAALGGSSGRFQEKWEVFERGSPSGPQSVTHGRDASRASKKRREGESESTPDVSLEHRHALLQRA
jgi:hypothetical protein